MKQSQTQKNKIVTYKYEYPQIEILKLSVADIVTTSGDPNEGEWDPQETVY
jgi:hypothetical protein